MTTMDGVVYTHMYQLDREEEQKELQQQVQVYLQPVFGKPVFAVLSERERERESVGGLDLKNCHQPTSSCYS